MNCLKLWLLRTLFGWLSRCPTATRLHAGALGAWVIRRFAKSRRRIVRRNIDLCFPDACEVQREQWTQGHIRAVAQSYIDRGVLWFGTPQAIDAMIELVGYEHLQRCLDAKTPVILLAPHFVGLDAAATALTRLTPSGATMYTPQSDPAVDQIVREGRARFNDTWLVSRKEGVRGLIRHLREGRPIYYLPDMDFGRNGSIFVPFFGILAATIPATAQIARKFDVAVLPVTEHWDAQTGRYRVEVHAALSNFPGEDTVEDATARQNALLEDWIRADPTQYYWVHRRFKTRPPGAPGLY